MPKFEIGDLPPADEPDLSVIPQGIMRELPPVPSNLRDLLNNRLVFELQRGSGGGEVEWLINGQAFDPATPVRSMKNPSGKTLLAQHPMDSFGVWEVPTRRTEVERTGWAAIPRGIPRGIGGMIVRSDARSGSASSLDSESSP